MENNAETSHANGQAGSKNADLKKAEEKLNFFDLANNLLSDLPERAQEIVKKRYGLAQAEPQTLEKIGQDNKITRERVRQIIFDVIKRVSQRKNDLNFKKAEDKIVFTISENNGIMEEAKLIEKLSGKDYQETNAVAFFAALSARVTIWEEKGKIRKAWFVAKNSLEKALEVSNVAKKIFEKEQKLLSDAEIVAKINASLREKNAQLSSQEILSYLAVLSDVRKNRFEKWGMAHWKEVSPKGTRERIYLVLKEKKKPLHFSEIAALIDQYGLGKRKAHPQTVHNELIKDDRFILVGRGIYALKEWGYKKGTIHEVLEDILGQSQKMLTKEEILVEVLKLRKVKKATIMINLNNAKFFKKVDNAYILKK